MSDSAILNHLQRLPLFNHLPDHQLELIADIVQPLHFEPGVLLVKQTMPAQGLFLFASGRGLLTQLTPNPATPSGGMIDQPVGEIRAGQFIGSKALLEPTNEAYSVRIVEPSDVLFLSRQRFLNLLSTQPELRSNIERSPGTPQQTVEKPMFASQRSDEMVVQVFRRHWWSFVRYSWLPLLISTLLIVGAVLLLGTSALLALVALALAVLIPVVIIYFLYVEWQDDALIITDQRVVRVTTTLLQLENQISEVALNAVLEVSITIPPADLFARLFRYGSVEIKTAGSQGNLSLSMVRKPNQVRDLVFVHRERVRQRAASDHQRKVQSEIAQVLSGKLDQQPAPIPKTAPPKDKPIDPVPAQPHLGFLQMQYEDKNGATVYRKHYTDWAAHIMLPALVIIASVFAMFVNLISPAFSGEWQGMGFIIPFFFILIGALTFYAGDWDWRNDMFVVSDDSVTIIKRRPLWLQNQVDQIRLSQVDNIVSTSSGIFDQLFKRGSVELVLVGADKPKSLHPVFKPEDVQEEISRRQVSYRARMAQQEEQKRRAELTEMLAAYHREISGQPPVNPNQTMWQQQAQEASAQSSPPEPPPTTLHDGSRPPRVPRQRRDGG